MKSASRINCSRQCEAGSADCAQNSSAEPVGGAAQVEAPEDPQELNRFFMERRWGDGLPLIAPTA